MNITLEPAVSYEHVNNLFQYYIYDMSEFMGWPPNDDGTFQVDDSVTGLKDYWQKPEHYPYLIKVDGEAAGFSLARKFPNESETFDMGQFFVLRKFKRKKVGESAFRLTAQKHPGQWLVRVLPDNLAAQGFWKKVVHQVADGAVVSKTENYKNNRMDFLRFNVATDLHV
jgi:predicted acetyltransferase